MRHAVRLLVLAFVGLVVLPAGSAVATTTHLAQADDRPVVRVGTEGTYPPFTYHDPDTDKLTGFDIEVIKAVAKKAGWRRRVRRDPVRRDLPGARRQAHRRDRQPGHDQPRARGASTTSRHALHLLRTASSSPPTGTNDIKTLADLKGKTTAQSATSNWAAGRPRRRRQGPVRSRTSPRRPSCSCRAASTRSSTTTSPCSTTSPPPGKDEIEIAGDAGDEVSKQALAFRKDDPRLRSEADEALAELPGRRHAREDLGEVLRRRRHGRERRRGRRVKGSDTARSMPRSSRTRPGRCCAALLEGTIPLTIDQLRDRPGPRAGRGAGPASPVNRLLQRHRARLHLGHPRHAAAGAAVHRLLRPARRSA